MLFGQYPDTLSKILISMQSLARMLANKPVALLLAIIFLWHLHPRLQLG